MTLDVLGMKHVERRHLYVRECVEDHLITVPFVCTDDNIADFFTKALESKRFFRLRDSIMNVATEHRACRASVSARLRVLGCGGAL